MGIFSYGKSEGKLRKKIDPKEGVKVNLRWLRKWLASVEDYCFSEWCIEENESAEKLFARQKVLPTIIFVILAVSSDLVIEHSTEQIYFLDRLID
ncbi:MAG: hypothetical protein B0A82_22010 [Alkalinema sp. CACIAM 70d]|nr:MAG: hypothetical protein B0A82_22010 [Alkalinema sp. CACIAM 70d]